jgi:hypothetical protein
MRLQIPLTEAMRLALLDLAASERRTPRMQAALLLERVLLDAEPDERVSPAYREVAHVQKD